MNLIDLKALLEQSRLSADVYNDRVPDSIVNLDGAFYRVLGSQTINQHHYVATYQSVSTGDVSVAIRGTSGEFGDFYDDAAIFFGHNPLEIEDFRPYIQSAIESHGSISLTGHSLGGYLAMAASDIDGVSSVYPMDPVGFGKVTTNPVIGAMLGLINTGAYYKSNVQLTYSENWDLVANAVHHAGIAISNGNAFYVPGTTGHDISEVVRGLEYQVAAHNFFGEFDGNFYDAPTEAYHGAQKTGARLLTGLTDEQLAQNFRMKIATDFDRGLTRSEAYSYQSKLFKAQGFSANEAYALTKFREAYKFGSQMDLMNAQSKLHDLGLSAPQPEDEVWAFCFSGETEVSMADGSKKRIDEIVAGDEVLAFSSLDADGKGELVPRRVVRLFHELTDKWLKLSNGVSVTPGHMFLTTDGTYEPISAI